MAYRSRQRKYGGGKFKSERQRRAMWANAPSAARAWAHNMKTSKPQWAGMHGGVRSIGRGRRNRKAGPSHRGIKMRKR